MIRMLVVLGAFLGGAGSADAGSDAAQVIGRVASVRGTVTVRPTGAAGEAAVPLVLGAQLLRGAVIKTDRDGGIRLLMVDRSVLDLGPSSQVTLARYDFDATTKKRSVGVNLFVGRMWARVTNLFGRERNYDVVTPNAVAGVRGTELVAVVKTDGTSEFTCVSGEVVVGNSAGGPQETLTALERASVGSDGRVTESQVTARDVQQLAAAVGGNAGRGDVGAGAGGGAGGENAGDGGGGSSEDDGGALDDLEQDSAPPLELDPGSGRVKVRGRIEVRDD